MPSKIKSKSASIQKAIKLIGERLAAVRKSSTKSQKDFAEIMRISPTTQSNYETGNATPPLSYFLELEQLGFDSGFILVGRAKNTPESKIQIEEIEDLLDHIPSILRKQGIDINTPGAIKTALKMLAQEKSKAIESGVDLADYLSFRFERPNDPTSKGQPADLKLALKTERLMMGKASKSPRKN